MTDILVITDDGLVDALHLPPHGTPRLRFISVVCELDQALAALEQEPDLVLLGAEVENPNWLTILRVLQKRDPALPVIVTSSAESISEAVEAFRAGASDYVTLPLEPDELMAAVERAMDEARLHQERDQLAEQLVQATDALARQQKELNAVHVIGRLTTSLLDVDVVLDRLTEIALHMTDARESMLLLRGNNNNDEEELYLRAQKNLRPELAEGFRTELNSTAAGRALRSGRPVIVTGEDAELAPGCPCDSVLHVPVRTPDQVIGLLTLSGRNSHTTFSSQDVLLLSTLVDYAAVAIQNARLFENVAKSESLMDGVFSSIASGVLTIGQDGRISLVNRAAREILHIPDVHAGVSLSDACPRIEQKIKPLVEATREQGEPTGPFEIDLSIPSGESLHLRMSLSPLRHGNLPSEGVTIVIEDLTRERKLESRFHLFQRYLSPTVIERLPDDPRELRLGGVRRQIACLFADIRGFVDFSLQHSPERLVETLNEYLGLGAEAVLAEDGTLDKFVGDSVVAFFNAPLPQENYALRAVRAASRIREATLELHPQLPEAHRLTYGIGISVGEAIVGNIGTAQRLDYTAIGPSVNLANRLQAAAEPGQILLTPEVYLQTRDQIEARPVTLRDIRGPEGPIQAYELLSVS